MALSGIALQCAVAQPQGESLQAASRGVRIDVTTDGYGSPDLSPVFISALTQADPV